MRKSRLMIVIGFVIMFLGIAGSMGSISSSDFSSFQIGAGMFGLGVLIVIIGAAWKFVAAE